MKVNCNNCTQHCQHEGCNAKNCPNFTPRKSAFEENSMKTEQEVREVIKGNDGEFRVVIDWIPVTDRNGTTVFGERPVEKKVSISDLAVIIGKALGVVE